MKIDFKIGQKFHRLTVLGPKKGSHYPCRCSCGNESQVSASDLKRGHTKSCGCLVADSIVIRLTKHGLSGTATYISWHAMKGRCFNLRDTNFKYYGGRGITVCERWKKFESFLEDMGERPSLNHSIDRFPNKNGNYEPGNCRWATKSQQSNNMRSNKVISFKGETGTVAEMCKSFDLSPVCARRVRERLRSGFSVKVAFLSGKIPTHNNYPRT